MSQEQNEIDAGTVFSCIETLQSVLSSQDTRTISLQCQELIKLLSVANECYKKKLEPSAPVDVGTTLTHVSSALDLVTRVFVFCKEVDINHQWVFTEHKNHFGSIFKANINALKLCFDQLDRVNITEDCRHLPVLQHLQCLCKVVLHFDTTLLIHTWKNTCKLLHKHRVVLSSGTGISESLQLQDFVDELCSTVESIYLKCIQTSGGAIQDFQRLVKACKQLLGCLITLLRDIDDGTGDTRSCYKLLLTMISSVPPSLDAKPVQDGPLQTIRSSLLCVSDPLLTILLERRCFAEQLLNRDLVAPGQYYAWCWCLVKVLVLFDKIPGGIQEYDYLEAESSEAGCDRQCAILDCVFDSVWLCHVELLLPLTVHTTASPSSATSLVPLYQHVCTVLCAFAVKLPSRHFHKLESVLMKHLLSEEPFSSLLASDVMSFILRWGSAALCKQFAFLFANVVLDLPLCTSVSHHVVQMASRAVTFMANEHKLSLIQAFNPSCPDYLKLWSQLSLEHFSQDHLKQVCGTLVILCSKCLEHVLHQHTTDYETLYYAIGALQHVYSLPNCNEFVSNDNHMRGITLLLQLWDWSLLISDLESSLVAQLIVCGLFKVTALVVDLLDISDVVKVLSYSSYFIHVQNSPVCVLISVNDMLEACRRVGGVVSRDLRDQFCTLMKILFHSLLTSPSWIVKERTLEAFKNFAQSTPYSDLGIQCIPVELNAFVVHYLDNKPYFESGSEDDLNLDAVVERLRCRLESLEKKLGMSFQEEHHETEDFVVDLTCEAQDDVLTTETNNKTAAVSDQENCDKDGLGMMEEGWQLLKTQAIWDYPVLSRIKSLHCDMTRELESQEDIIL